MNFAKHMFQQTVQGVQTRTFQYDALGRLVWEEHPEFRHLGTQYGVSYQYDDAGRMTSKTDPRGIVTTASYDGLNRPLSVAYSDSTPAASYSYDQGLYGIGRLSSASNSAASSSYTYDRMGRRLQEDKTIGGIAFSMSWAYNQGGLLTSYTLPNGTTISQAHDNLGRPTSISSDWVDANHPATLASNFVYHPAGALTSVDYGNGTTSTRSYTSGGLLKTLQHGTSADPGQLLDFEYDYQEGMANNGRIMGITDHNDASKSQIYSYDGFQRLLSAETQGSHWGLSWGYDRYGNRLSQAVTKGTAPSQSLGVEAQSNRVSGWSYDRAGNTLNDGSHSYAFDANNLMASLDGGSTVYKYDAGGSRVSKTTGGQTTTYVFGVAEHLSGTGWSKLYIKLGNEKLAEYSGNTTRFFHSDHRFTPRLRTDLSGSPNQSWDDLPFGEDWQSTGGGGDQHRLTGHHRDAESGNEYAGARYYSSDSGRWGSVDPVLGKPSMPQSLNRFAYVVNDPVNLIDRDGREWQAFCRAVEAWPFEGGTYEQECEYVYYARSSGRGGGASQGGGAGRVGQGGGGPNFGQLATAARDQLWDKLHGMNPLSPDCQQLFDSLKIDLHEYLDKLDNANIVNAQVDNRAVQGLSQQAAFQHWWPLYAANESLNIAVTVNGRFAQSPGLNAWTLAWDIQTVFFRGPGAISAETLGHEVFHLFGKVDEEIQGRWGLPVTPGNTSNITQEFKKKCL